MTSNSLPGLLDHRDEVLATLAHRPAGLFLDIDGTLAPIVPDPAKAAVPAAVRDALELLSGPLTVAAVTGRDTPAARRIVGLDSIIYAGNHGAEWWEDGQRRFDPLAEPWVQRVHELAVAVERELGHLDGLYVEDKGPSVSLHYRAAKDHETARKAILDFVRAHADGLVVFEGKRIVETRAPVDLTKGTAVTSILARHGLRAAIVVGDDTTDVDAFRALSAARKQGVVGMNVAVVGTEAPPEVARAADYQLDGPPEVERFLSWLAGELG